MGRAIVREPKAFLMDEPLSNLDAKLRVSMRAQLGALHARLATTTIYVTHDQIEAMTLGQRVAVMRDGKIQQVDTPQSLYSQPANLYVAAFIGSPAMNLVEAEAIDGTPPLRRLRDRPSFRRCPVTGPSRRRAAPRGVRGQRLRRPVAAAARGRVEVVEELGADTNVIFGVDAPPVEVGEIREAAGDDETIATVAGSLFTARVDPSTAARPGAPLRLAVDPSRFHYFDPVTGLRLVAAPEPAAVA